MKGKTVKESAITSSHLMLIKDSGNFIFDGGKTIPMVHGGILMTLMDEIAGMVATKHAGTHVATACIDMQFVAPAFAGNRMILKSSVNYTTKTSMEIGVRIEAENMKKPTDLNKIIRLQTKKTGALIEWSLQAGPLMAGEKTDSLKRFAKLLGLAFQIRDDILDIEGESHKVGKNLRKDYGKENVVLTEVGPALGVHAGPGSLVFAIQVLDDGKH